MLDLCEPLDKIKSQGIAFGKVACLARCSGAKVKPFRSDQSNIHDFCNCQIMSLWKPFFSIGEYLLLVLKFEKWVTFYYLYDFHLVWHSFFWLSFNIRYLENRTLEDDHCLKLSRIIYDDLLVIPSVLVKIHKVQNQKSSNYKDEN